MQAQVGGGGVLLSSVIQGPRWPWFCHLQHFPALQHPADGEKSWRLSLGRLDGQAWKGCTSPPRPLARAHSQGHNLTARRLGKEVSLCTQEGDGMGLVICQQHLPQTHRTFGGSRLGKTHLIKKQIAETWRAWNNIPPRGSLTRCSLPPLRTRGPFGEDVWWESGKL